MKYKTTSLTLLLCLSSIVQVYAGQAEQAVHNEIDLSSEGNIQSSTSHRCVYECKFDNSGHWQECCICGNTTSRQNHILNSKYTVGYNAYAGCSKQNVAIVYCTNTQCQYFQQQNYKQGHEPRDSSMYIGYGSGTGSLDVYRVCKECGEIFNSWSGGHTYYVDIYNNGNKTKLTNPYDIKHGSWLEDDISGGNIQNIYRRNEKDSNKWSIATSLEDGLITVSATLKLPSNVRGWSEQDLMDNKNALIEIEYNSVTDGYKNSVSIAKPTKSVDKSNNTLTVTHSVALKSDSVDRMKLGTCTLKCKFFFQSENYLPAYEGFRDSFKYVEEYTKTVTIPLSQDDSVEIEAIL